MLTIHRAERADTLIEPLAALLSRAPADTFAPDVIAVPSRGVERWLAQQLSLSLGASTGGNDGVSANILFLSPGRVVNEVLATICGTGPDDDPWVGSRFVWAVLHAIDDATAAGEGGPLAHHLGIGAENAGHRLNRRYATAANLANLFSSYADNRPDMINAWLAGSDTDGVDTELDDDMCWQPERWRRIRSRTDVPSPAERLRNVCQALEEGKAAVRLPERLELFWHVLAWGFVGNFRNVARIVRAAAVEGGNARLLAALRPAAEASFRGDIEAGYRAFVDHRISQFKYAFFSKFLYFTSDLSKPGPRCLILDDRVATALRAVTGKSYIPDSAAHKPGAYVDYCRDVHRWSLKYECAPDQIEWRLYRFGQLIGTRERWLRAEVSLYRDRTTPISFDAVVARVGNLDQLGPDGYMN
ncbi:exodeoxyribonuclease V subunit gamma [Mycolicibacterium goodii]|uniref:exodeoxyribonuclease V subunit gamma n=1 Tax=Mycolicibacterium goodii TaxID=134601 RepID=UPI000C263C36|nr:exodeoxyribonuclease V subunit gamma [Mycolicibacterium goodii]PJK23867.1 hypothetical protein CSX11_03320 [Mycolicibacterium goodii]